jgi:hypothetical protein
MNEIATRMPLNSLTTSNEVATSEETRLFITQSSYFTAAFNGAIFDGPLRLYFAQAQEGLALNLYFELRAQMGELAEPRPGRVSRPNLFVMIYPTEEHFDLCFGPPASRVIGAQAAPANPAAFGQDLVLGMMASDLESDLATHVARAANVLRLLVSRAAEAGRVAEV